MREAGELTTMSEERSEYLNSLASGQFLVAIGFCVLQVLSQFDRHPVVVGSGRDGLGITPYRWRTSLKPAEYTQRA